MSASHKKRVRLSVEQLDERAMPSSLTISPPGSGDTTNVEFRRMTPNPGLVNAEIHTGGLVDWTPGAGSGAQLGLIDSTASTSHDRPFHLEESGSAVINPDGTINGAASGQATHLGAFTLHDTTTIIGVEVTPDGVILHIVGHAELDAANGDKLCGSITGTVNLTTGEGTLTFEWTGGDGRFADATGTTVWQVTLNPDLTYSAVADGVINY